MSIRLRALERTEFESARALLAVACPHDRAAAVAHEILFEPGLGRVPQPMAAVGQVPGESATGSSGESILGLVVCSGAWVRLLAVHPDAREQGIGSALLSVAEARMARAGAGTLRVMDEPGNYLAPGIDTRNHQAIDWLERRGYRRIRENVNLLVDVHHNPRVSEARSHDLAHALAPEYCIRRARPSDAPMLAADIERAFSAGWAFEVQRALESTPPAVHIALHQDKLAAFAAHDGNNRGLGWFGPTGTVSQHRKRGLGRALLCACLCDVARAGHRVCEIAWIGPRAFYERAVGVMGERRFAVLTKELS